MTRELARQQVHQHDLGRYFLGPPAESGLVFGFGVLEPAEIRKGIVALRQALASTASQPLEAGVPLKQGKSTPTVSPAATGPGDRVGREPREPDQATAQNREQSFNKLTDSTQKYERTCTTRSTLKDWMSDPAVKVHCSHAARDPKVMFEPFVGIGPRRYFDLFSMKLGEGYPLKRKVAGRTAPWEKNSAAIVRVPMLPTSYLERESRLTQLVPAVLVPTSSEEKT